MNEQLKGDDKEVGDEAYAKKINKKEIKIWAIGSYRVNTV